MVDRVLPDALFNTSESITDAIVYIENDHTIPPGQKSPAKKARPKGGKYDEKKGEYSLPTAETYLRIWTDVTTTNPPLDGAKQSFANAVALMVGTLDMSYTESKVHLSMWDMVNKYTADMDLIQQDRETKGLDWKRPVNDAAWKFDDKKADSYRNLLFEYVRDDKAKQLYKEHAGLSKATIDFWRNLISEHLVVSDFVTRLAGPSGIDLTKWVDGVVTIASEDVEMKQIVDRVKGLYGVVNVYAKYDSHLASTLHQLSQQATLEDVVALFYQEFPEDKFTEARIAVPPRTYATIKTLVERLKFLGIQVAHRDLMAAFRLNLSSISASVAFGLLFQAAESDVKNMDTTQLPTEQKLAMDVWETAITAHELERLGRLPQPFLDEVVKVLPGLAGSLDYKGGHVITKTQLEAAHDGVETAAKNSAAAFWRVQNAWTQQLRKQSRVVADATEQLRLRTAERDDAQSQLQAALSQVPQADVKQQVATLSSQVQRLQAKQREDAKIQAMQRTEIDDQKRLIDKLTQQMREGANTIDAANTTNAGYAAQFDSWRKLETALNQTPGSNLTHPLGQQATISMYTNAATSEIADGVITQLQRVADQNGALLVAREAAQRHSAISVDLQKEAKAYKQVMADTQNENDQLRKQVKELQAALSQARIGAAATPPPPPAEDLPSYKRVWRWFTAAGPPLPSFGDKDDKDDKEVKEVKVAITRPFLEWATSEGEFQWPLTAALASVVVAASDEKAHEIQDFVRAMCSDPLWVRALQNLLTEEGLYTPCCILEDQLLALALASAGNQAVIKNCLSAYINYREQCRGELVAVDDKTFVIMPQLWQSLQLEHSRMETDMRTYWDIVMQPLSADGNKTHIFFPWIPALQDHRALRLSDEERRYLHQLKSKTPPFQEVYEFFEPNGWKNRRMANVLVWGCGLLWNANATIETNITELRRQELGFVLLFLLRLHAHPFLVIQSSSAKALQKGLPSLTDNQGSLAQLIHQQIDTSSDTHPSGPGW